MTPRPLLIVLSLAIPVLLVSHTRGENPQWRGKPFRHILSDESVADDGATVRVSDAAMLENGVGIINLFATQGVYFAGPDGITTIARQSTPGFANASSWTLVGTAEGGMLFQPIVFSEDVPIYYWKDTLSQYALSSPSHKLPIYGNGNIVYSTNVLSQGRQIWLWNADSGTTVLLNETIIENLGPHHGFDGTSIVFQSGSSLSDATLWLRSGDGTITRIIGVGDPLPGSTGTFKGFLTATNVTVNGGWAYIVGESQEANPTIDRVLFRANGFKTEVILTRQSPAPAPLTGEIGHFDIMTVQDGQVLLDVTQPTGGFGVVHWEAGTLSAVATNTDRFDGQIVLGYRGFRGSLAGNDILFQVNAVIPGVGLVNALYSTVNYGSPDPVVFIENHPEGVRVFLPGQTGKSYQLETSPKLTHWTPEGASQTSDGGEIEWIVALDAEARFFRVTVTKP